MAITVGDPRGIGPEVVAAAVGAADVETTVVGPFDVISRIAADYAVGVGRWDEGEAGGEDELTLAGRLTGLAVEAAVRLWSEGAVDAIVTGPGHKRALHAAGYRSRATPSCCATSPARRRW